MSHRVREAMRDGSAGSNGRRRSGIVEVDETIIGKVEGAPKKFTRKHYGLRNVVLTLVERGGSARSFHVDGTTVENLEADHHRQHCPRNRDDDRSSKMIPEIGEEFASHDTVNHGEEEYERVGKEPSSSRPMRLRAIIRSSSAE